VEDLGGLRVARGETAQGPPEVRDDARSAPATSVNIDSRSPEVTVVRNPSITTCSISVQTVVTTSSIEAKWLKIVRRDTSARSASWSTLNRPPSEISALAASRMARRCRALRAERRSMVTLLH
jgi:hypothetical protein